MKKWMCLLLVSFLLYGCNSTSKKEEKISKVAIDVSFDLFHNALFTATPKDLPKLKKEYPYMFPVQMPDSVVVDRMQDSTQQFLYKEVRKVYGDFTSQKKELKNLFQHIKFYQKDFVVPTVVTDLTGVSYQDRVLYANNLLLISLDMFLGKEHEIYQGFASYLAESFTPKHLTSQVAKTIIDRQLLFDRNRTFLGMMVFEGKKMYLLDLYLPHVTNGIKMGYTAKKMQWAKENEAAVWSYFIKNDLLYSNSSDLKERFIDTAPFSKFYTTADMDSSGQIGVYMGWQIVKAFMENNSVSVQEMIKMDAQEILNLSKFKPRK